MQAIVIVATVFAMLTIGVIGAFSLINYLKRRHIGDLLMVIGAGVVFLGSIFLMISVVATVVIGSILSILGWPTLGVGFVLVNLWEWSRRKKESAAAASPSTG